MIAAKATFKKMKATAIMSRVNIVSADLAQVLLDLDSLNGEIIGTTADDKITFAEGWRDDIKTAIEAYGVSMTSAKPADYDSKVALIGPAVSAPIKTALDSANEEASASVDAAIDIIKNNYAAIKAAITDKGVDMTGIKPSGYDEKIAAIPAAKENFAPVPASGQAGTDATGLIAYPSPRFVDNSDGTITDKLTGLMWAKNLNLASPDFGRYASWSEAKTTCEGKTIGGYNDWRLPNVKEMDSLMDWANYPLDLYLRTSGFANAGLHNFWLNTVAQNDTSYAFYIASQNGVRTVDLKIAQKGYVPVRGPVAP